MAAWVLGSAILGGCPNHTPPALVEARAIDHYSFSFGRTIESNVLTMSDSEPVDISGGSPWSTRWDGSLDISFFRDFKDGSVGQLVRLGEIQVQDTLDSSPSPSRASDLSGRAFEMRVFSTGEILEINLFDPLVGPDREGEYLLPVWAGMSPIVPRILPGETEAQSANIPLVPSEGREVRFVQTVTWTNTGRTDLAGIGRCHHFTYEGGISGKGVDQVGPSDPMTGAADYPGWRSFPGIRGTVRGEVWLSTEDLSVARHDFRWDLETRLPFVTTAGAPQSLVETRSSLDGHLLQVMETP